MKYLIEETTLTGIADAVRQKKGTTDLIQVSNLATEISNIQGGGVVEELTITSNGTYNPPTGIDGYAPIVVNVPQDGAPPEEAYTIKDDCRNRFSYNGWNWFIDMYGSKITMSATNLNSCFNMSNKLVNVPFTIETIDNRSQADTTLLFNGCIKLETVKSIHIIKVGDMSGMFSNCSRLRYLPEITIDNWSALHDANLNSVSGMFNSCISLREIPESLVKNLYSYYASNSYAVTYNGFKNCNSLDEVRGIAFHPTRTSSGNCFSSAFDNCYRLKEIIFATNDDGTAKTYSMKNNTIDLTKNIGYKPGIGYVGITNANSGITEDKMVNSAETYEALKNDPDWFAVNVAYSRYNHNSAVNTINSLPDTSAYLATDGGTNTIKFKGDAGSATDGGAINTLTEEEIAVATAKGWTVSLA